MSAKGGGTDGWTNGRTYVRTDKIFSYSTGFCPLLDLLSKKKHDKGTADPMLAFFVTTRLFFGNHYFFSIRLLNHLFADHEIVKGSSAALLSV